LYFFQNYEVSEITINHARKVYGILDLFGDFGGVMEVMLLITHALLSPVSEHSFLVKAISKLYMANTTDSKLF
jgi:hypothetical protein